MAGELCGGRLAFLLEGGYETEAVGESVCEVSEHRGAELKAIWFAPEHRAPRTSAPSQQIPLPPLHRCCAPASAATSACCAVITLALPSPFPRMCQVFRALLGQPSVEAVAADAAALPRHPEPEAEVAELVAQLRRIHGLDG